MKTRTQRKPAVYLSLLLLIVVFCCSGEAKEKQVIRVQLDWFPSIEFAGMLVAIDKGWFAEQGIEVKPSYDGLDITKFVLDGKADVGLHSAHEILRAIPAGKKLKAFAAKYQFNPASLIVSKESGISKIADLKGKTIGIFSDQEFDTYRVVLGSAGLFLSDVKFRRIPWSTEIELIELLKRRTIDSIIGWEFNWPITFALRGYKVRQFPSYKYGFDFYGIVYFCKPDYLEAHRELLKKFLAVVRRGWLEVYRKPEFYTREVVKKWYPKDRFINGSLDLTLRQQLLELKISKRYLFEGVGPNKFGSMSRARWLRSIEIAKKYGVIPADSPITVEQIYDPSVAKDLPPLGAQ